MLVGWYCLGGFCYIYLPLVLFICYHRLNIHYIVYVAAQYNL